jgi:hypothetical protein
MRQIIKHIILTSSLFGSVYLMAKSLELINRSHIEGKRIPCELIIINGLTFVVSGYIFISGSFRCCKL